MRDREENRGRHTPGPWSAYKPESDGQVPIVASAGGCPDAVIAVVGYDCPERSIEANARLIAAAPELLAALQLMAEGYAQYAAYAESMCVIGRGMSHPVVGNGVNHETVLRLARAAIAKAEGGAA